MDPENELRDKPWFYPQASRAAADDMLLQSSEPNSFLVRKSSKPSCYALSMKHVSKETEGTNVSSPSIEHALIQCSVQPGPPPALAYTLEVEGEVRSFSSFAEIIDALDLVPLSSSVTSSSHIPSSAPLPTPSSNTSSPAIPIDAKETTIEESRETRSTSSPASPMDGSTPPRTNSGNMGRVIHANRMSRERTGSLGPIIASAGLSPVVSPALVSRSAQSGGSNNLEAPLSPRAKQREKKKGLRLIGRRKEGSSDDADNAGGEKCLLPLLGVPLDQLPANESTQCPDFVEKLTRHLRKTALEIEGIFRHSGSSTEITRMQKEFESGLMSIDLKKYDPHAVAGLLKKFFRELPQPLVPSIVNDKVRAVIALGEQLHNGGSHSEEDIGKTIATELHDVIENHVPKANYLVLRSLSQLLRDVGQRSSVNMMTPDNLIICLVPTLRCVPGLILYSITHYEQVFDNARYLNHPDVPELREQSRQRAGSGTNDKDAAVLSPQLRQRRAGSLTAEKGDGSGSGPRNARPNSTSGLLTSSGGDRRASSPVGPGAAGNGSSLASSAEQASGSSSVSPRTQATKNAAAAAVAAAAASSSATSSSPPASSAFFSAFAALNPLSAAVTSICWTYGPSLSAASDLGQRCQPAVQPSSDFSVEQFEDLTEAVTAHETRGSVDAKKLASRRRLLLRLAESERHYAARLGQYVNRVLVPLSQYPAGFDLAASQVDVLFANIDQLYGWHRALSAELDQRLEMAGMLDKEEKDSNGTPATGTSSSFAPVIGDLLQHIAPSDLYQAYSNRYDSSVTTFKQHRADFEGDSKKLADFLSRIKNQDASFNIDLCSYLLAPLQRLQTYADIIQALTQATDPEHPEMQACQRAVMIMNKTLNHVFASTFVAAKIGTEDKAFTKEELAKYDGSDESLPIYLVVLGRVFDVSSGSGYYGKGATYNTFCGRDASRAFVTGCFSRDEAECPNIDSIEGLTEQQIVGLDTWISMYTDHETYESVGHLVDEDGNNVWEKYDTLEKRMTFAKKEDADEAKKEL